MWLIMLIVVPIVVLLLGLHLHVDRDLAPSRRRGLVLHRTVLSRARRRVGR